MQTAVGTMSVTAGLLQVFRLKEELEDRRLAYPDYYLKAFHAYEEGNLNWLAAFEVESAMLSFHVP